MKTPPMQTITITFTEGTFSEKRPTLVRIVEDGNKETLADVIIRPRTVAESVAASEG